MNIGYPMKRKGKYNGGSGLTVLELIHSIWSGSFREIGSIFPIKILNFKLWKMPKLLHLRFPEG